MSTKAEISRLIQEDDEERSFRAVGDFVRKDPSHALATGKRLIRSTRAKERVLGASILAQLADVSPAYRGAIGSSLIAAFDADDDAPVVAAVVTALGHAADDRARGALIGLVRHPSADVRFAVAFALPAVGLDGVSAGALRVLSADEDPAVRDWATFGLAESDLVDDETRGALLARADDSDADTRAEAIYGLARRRDPSAPGLIEREMESATVGELILRARDELLRNEPSAT